LCYYKHIHKVCKQTNKYIKHGNGRRKGRGREIYRQNKILILKILNVLLVIESQKYSKIFK